MTKSEQETTINICADSNVAHVYTCDPRYVRKLDKLVNTCPEDCQLIKQADPGFFYEIPVSYIKFSKRKTNLTSEQKEAFAERMKLIRLAQKDEETNA